MPGLSKYKGPNEDGIYTEDPIQSGEWAQYNDVQPEELMAAKDEYDRSLGFANPGRGGLEQMLHGMYKNVPREHLDRRVILTDDEENDLPPISWREIIQLLQQMSPLNERQNP